MSNQSLTTLSYQPQINDNFENHDEFVNKIKSYAHNLGFTIRLGKSECYNKSENEEKTVQKRTLLCSRASFAKPKESNSNNKISKQEQNRVSQHCGCSFYICASLNNLKLWQIINIDLTHNHLMVEENHRFCMSNKQNIPDNVKQRIELLRRAGVDVPTICTILKEEFGDYVTWMYDDLYNFIYHLEELGLEKRELDAEEFVNILDQFKYNDIKFFYYIDINEDMKRLERAIWMFSEQRINYSRFNDIIVYDNTYKTNHFKIPFGIFTGINNYGYINQHALAVILTDDDHAIANAYSKVLQPLGTKHRLCQWHLIKNIMKNLSAKLNTS
ncbi:36987_t:CDS:2 [Racocetra persica]|uniref:36987_t:CDS:1 n=1 Tax=Racocetra persica TaxID=160502 RepID=A0ACA9NFI3_9GLOM|nr:36987_t:CDS:2 [Racocetra persica]